MSDWRRHDYPATYPDETGQRVWLCTDCKQVFRSKEEFNAHTNTFGRLSRLSERKEKK